VSYPHRPVLVNQVVRALLTTPDGIYVDGTAGTGGHSEAVGRALGAKGRLLCLDRDPESLRICRERLSFLGERVALVRGNYAAAHEILRDFGIDAVDGLLLDLGMSSHQLEESGRGFSFARDEPLDMRMDPNNGMTAEQLINGSSTRELEKILREFGEEKRAKAIAKRIVQKRPISSSLQLADLIAAAVPRSRRARKHPATRTFQAIRIAVNNELEVIEQGLYNALASLCPGGRFLVISFHSLEDRIVKQIFRRESKDCVCPPEQIICNCGHTASIKIITKKPVQASQEEVSNNPRARSAKMRVAEKL